MASAKFAKEMAESENPIYYGSTTRTALDTWYYCLDAEFSNAPRKPPRNISKGQRKAAKKNMERLIEKALLTGVLTGREEFEKILKGK